MNRTIFGTARSGIVPVARYQLFIGNLLLTLIVVGYPLSASISQLMGLETSAINIGFRIIVLMLAIQLALWSISRRLYRIDVPILLFLFLYTLRMVWDLNYSTFTNITDDFMFYIAATLLPTLAIGGGRAWYDERLCLRMITWIGGTGCILVGFLVVLRPDETLQAILDNRAAFHFLNPISVGYHGLFVSAASLMLIASSNSRRHTDFYASIGYGAIAILGTYLLIAAGSRGPFVALVAAIGVTGLANTQTKSGYALLCIFLATLMSMSGAFDLILQRFLLSGEDASSIERLLAMNLSIRAAIDHPLLGHAYIEPQTGIYPHNQIIEAALALGLGGGALLLYIHGSTLSRAWFLARRGELLLPFLAITALAASWIAGAIWSAGLFFTLAWLIRDQRHEISAVSNNASDTTKINLRLAV